jgi:MFS family permease
MEIRPFKNRNVLLIVAGFFFLFGGFSTTHQFLVALLKREGLETVGNASLLTIYSVFFVGNLLWFRMLKILGLKLSLVVGSIPYVTFSLAAATSEPVTILIAAALTGFGASLLWNSSTEIMRQSCNGEDLGKVLGAKQSALVTGASLFVGITNLTLSTDASTLFISYGIISLIGVCLFSLLQVQDSPTAISAKDYTGIGRFLPVAPLIACAAFSMVLKTSSIPLIAVEHFGELAMARSGLAINLAAMFSGILSGFLADRFGGLKVALIFGIIVSACCGMILAENFSLLIFASMMMGITASGLSVAVLAGLSKRLTDKENLQSSAAVYLFGTVGSSSGFLGTLFLSPETMVVMTGVLALIAVTLLFFRLHKT